MHFGIAKPRVDEEVLPADVIGDRRALGDLETARRTAQALVLTRNLIPERLQSAGHCDKPGGVVEDRAPQPDEQIGRQVAIKRMRSETPSQDQVTRFLREARIQGRLEHPAVVPVHELYYDGENRPFFVMKNGWLKLPPDNVPRSVKV